MNNYNEVKEYIKNSKGIYTYKELEEKNISNFYIKKMIEDKIIEKYRRGIYVRTDIFEDMYFILQLKYSNIYYSHNTAIHFFNESEKTPSIVELTTYSGKNMSNLSNNVKVHYVSKSNLDIGAIKIKTPMGFYVNSYNLERTVCDIIKNDNSELDKEQTNNFIKYIFLNNKINSILLLEYAKKLKCEKKVRKVMEVLM